MYELCLRINFNPTEVTHCNVQIMKAIPTDGEILQQMYKSPVWKALQAQAGGELTASGSL